MNRSQCQQLIQAMHAELNRSMRSLRAPRHPKPYFISYLIRDTEALALAARYGALYQDKLEKRRSCYTEVRVGTYGYDQTSKGGLDETQEEQEQAELFEFPIDSNIDSFRFSLWRLTDSKFREAVAKFHGKKSRDVSFLDQNRSLPSFQKAPSAEAVDIRPLKDKEIDADHWREYLKKASAVYKKYSEIKNSYVELTIEHTTKIFTSSEGVTRVWQEPVFSLHSYFWYHTKKLDQDYSVVHHVADIKELPTVEDFIKEIKERIEQYRLVEVGETMTSFAGPVLLSAKAAGLFIHEVVGHRLEGSRLLSESEGRTFKDKLNQKIMHEDLTIIDDPGVRQYAGQTLLAHYPYDDEGTPARRALLVDKGVLKGFLTTRSPLKKQGHQSNGHARNQLDERPVSRMANLIVESHSQLTWADMKQKLIEEIKKQKVPFGIILLDVEGGETETDAYNFQAFMGQITRAVKVYPNGKERYVKGVDFVGTPLSSLSHIVAVSKESEVDNGFCGAESGTIPVSTVAPALLMSTLELQAKSPSKITQYALPLPWFDEDEKKLSVKKKQKKKKA
ncbi:MAG: TldD/PmbA family protein [Proteobacteria bacterium]|nr:MAG: TldD/PmbA family protein [Pseudomonadota bacterium]